MSELTIEMKKLTAEITALNTELSATADEAKAYLIKQQIAFKKSLLVDFLKEHLRG